jgi:hypothetical protein
MKESTVIKKEYDRFLNSLLSSIEQFRLGEDQVALDCLLNSFIDLEIILEYYPYSEKLGEIFNEIITIIEEININMKNKDIVALTDILEFKLYPSAKKWFEGGVFVDCSKTT